MLNTDLTLDYIYRKSSKNSTPKLLLLLHGYGSNEEDLFSFESELPQDFFVVSARAPIALPYGGFGWYDINFMDSQKFNNVAQAQESISKIRTFIAELIEEYSLDQNEVWLCGFSQGAILSYALTLQNQGNIKRVICLSGYPAADIIGKEISGRYQNLEFFVSHGTEDAVIPVEWARKGDELLKELELPYVYKEYKSGHGLVPQNFYDLLGWINNNL